MTVDWILLGLRILAPLLLYLFLGLTIYQLLRDRRAEQVPNAFLHRLDTLDAWLPLALDTSLGREPDNTFVLESEFISAHHATLAYQDGAWWIADLGSTNGTCLNEIPICTPMPLDYGDIVSLGDIQFRLERRYK